MRGIPRYTLVWGARYTLGARYLSKNMVIGIVFPEWLLVTPVHAQGED